LYFAYRDLDAKIAARDAALETWRGVNARVEAGYRDDAQQEARAREQYFRLQQNVENVLTGRLLERTRANNGTTGGTFRGLGGVQTAERRLRLLASLPINGDRLLRPADEPTVTPVAYDWHAYSCEALARRAELRRQNWKIKRRELELLASKTFSYPS